MFNDSNVMASKNKKLGVKIVDNPYNKRESDPFNTKNIIQGKSPSLTYQDKLRLVEKSQNEVENKLREIAPFHNGIKNDSFAPVHQKFVAVIGDKYKFDPIYNYESQKDDRNLNDKNNNFKKFSNSSTSMTNTTSKDNGNYNWWNNRLDEIKASEKAEKIKNQSSNEKNSNQHFGKKKLDFEEETRSKRSYLEEFNQKNNQMQKGNIDKKIQQRIEIQNKVSNKVATSIDYSKKEVLQENGHLSLDEKYSIDYRKERARIQNALLENKKNKMKLHDNNRKELSDYYDMNNKLIKENLYEMPSEK